MHPLLRRCSVAAVLCCAMAAAAQPVTLGDAEREALLHNPALRVRRFDIAAARADSVTAGLPPSNPQATVYGDILPTGGAYALNQTSYGGSVAFPVELGGKRDARLDVAREQTRVAEESVDDAVRAVRLSVRLAFTDVLLARDQRTLAQESVISLDSVVALNRVRVAAHDASETELARSEIAAERARVDLAGARIAFENALAALRGAMGRNAGDSLEITGDLAALPAAPIASADAAAAFARSHRSDLLSQRHTLVAQEANRRLQDANAAIDLSISADLLRQQGATFWGTTLSFPLPLFNRNQGEREKAAVNASQAEAQVEATERSIGIETATTYREFQARAGVVNRLRTEVLPRVRSVRDGVEFAYTRGATSILDFLEAQRTYNDSMREYLDALAALHRSYYLLRAAMGE